MANQPLRIGLLAYTQLQHHALAAVVEASGHNVAARVLVSQVDEGVAKSAVSDLDAWIAYLDDSVDASEPLENWLDEKSVPVIFCNDSLPTPQDEAYNGWCRRLTNKLNELTGAINLAHSGEGKAHQVWVLGASTGGPAAVKQFLNELPPNLGVGFIYVQHIDKGFNQTLVGMINQRSHYTAYLANHGDILRSNQVALVSPEHATQLLNNGTFAVSQGAWQAPYSPSVDSMVADVAQVYGKNSGMIVFSGMGDDGTASSRLMRKQGGKVWVQSPGSCTSSSMPECVIAAGEVQFKGTPFALAQELVKHVQAVRQVPLGAVH